MYFSVAMIAVCMKPCFFLTALNERSRSAGKQSVHYLGIAVCFSALHYRPTAKAVMTLS